MNWVADGVKNSIWSFVMDFISDIMTKAFGLISDLILQTSNINQYFDVTKYIVNIQAVAGALLALAVVWEATKQLSGNVLPGNEKSLGTIAGQTLVAGAMIFFLPWSVVNIFLRLNNALITMIKSIGVTVDMNTISGILRLGTDPNQIGGLVIVLTLILVIGFLLIGVAAGIRFIELVIIILVAPVVAISAVKSYDAIQVWVRETVAVVFTQCIQLLLLQFIMVILLNVQGVMTFMLAIGCVVVAIRGPQVLRQFLYSSGTGSAAIGAAGSVGRMAAMKIMVKSFK